MVSQTMIILSKDGNGNINETTIPFPIAVDSSKEFLQKIDTCARAIINLSMNSYYDTRLIRTLSVGEEISD